MAKQALGLLETRGLACLVVGVDAMLKSANVELVGPMKQIGNAMCNAVVTGDVAAVKAALDAGAARLLAPEAGVVAELLAKEGDEVQAGQPLIGGGADTGLSAKCEEAGGIDLIVIYNSGRYRMAGRGSLAGLMAYGNANEIVCEMAHEVLPEEIRDIAQWLGQLLAD